MFLSKEELQRLTGYKQAVKQIEHLVERGIKFHMDAFNRPVVLVSDINAVSHLSDLSYDREAVEAALVEENL